MMRRAYLFTTSLIASLAMAQTPAPQPAPAAGYTPPPVSTTYRPLSGKLFFTEAERERLDKARQDGVQVVDGEIVSRSPRVDGLVRSSTGRTTYWVDGRQRVAADSTKDVSASATMTGAEPTVSFRETLQVSKGKVTESSNPAVKKPAKSGASPK